MAFVSVTTAFVSVVMVFVTVTKAFMSAVTAFVSVTMTFEPVTTAFVSVTVAFVSVKMALVFVTTALGLARSYGVSEQVFIEAKVNAILSTLSFSSFSFLDAPSHLYMRSCPSVGPSVRLSRVIFEGEKYAY